MSRRFSRDLCLFCGHKLTSRSQRWEGAHAFRAISTASQERGNRSDTGQTSIQDLDDAFRNQLYLYNPVDYVRPSFSADVASPPTGLIAETRHVLRRNLTAKLTTQQEIGSTQTTVREELHRAFRRRQIRYVLRTQLTLCQWPKDILRVVAIAMQRKETAQQLATLGNWIVKAFRRMRNHVAEPRILASVNTIFSRLKASQLPISDEFLAFALEAAARARSLPALKKYLKELRQRGVPLDAQTFKAVVDSLKIGQEGVGAVRQYIWTGKDILEVLVGSKGSPSQEDYHLGLLRGRNNWTALSAWVAALARCGEGEEVWREWELWQRAQRTGSAKPSPESSSSRPGTMDKDSTNVVCWFVQQLCVAGEFRRAWQIAAETDISFDQLLPTTRDALLDHFEHATKFDDAMRQEILTKYVRDLERIEEALGVRWVAEGEDGHHITQMDLTDALERLSDPQYVPDLVSPIESGK